MSDDTVILGLEELNLKLDRMMGVVPKRLGRELYREAEEIMGESKEKYVPVDLGNLRSSGFVKQPSYRGTNQHVTSVTVPLGFGGPAAPYALIQHEAMHFNHTVGGPKYLEKPALERAPNIPENIAKRLDVMP